MSRLAALRVVIAGGGTGGHLYPGLAVARELMRRRPEASVVFAGTRRGIESRVVPDAGFGLEVIRSAGLKGQSLLATARNAALLPLSAWDAWRLISRLSPHLVMGLGGYSSGPVVGVAAVRRIPTLILEQNLYPGLTNRLLGRLVQAAAVSFTGTLPYFGRQGFVSGNPVRAEFFEAEPEPRSRGASEECHILVIGGSQGAHALNTAMAGAARHLAEVRTRLVITHQAGERDVTMVREAYRRVGIDARVEMFLEPVATAMRGADLIICRAGATTIAEVAAVGRASILVPLSSAADDHQRTNASEFVAAGAAELADEQDLAATLAARIPALIADPDRRLRMARAAGKFARPDATQLIVDRALAMVEG